MYILLIWEYILLYWYYFFFRTTIKIWYYRKCHFEYNIMRNMMFKIWRFQFPKSLLKLNSLTFLIRFFLFVHIHMDQPCHFYMRRTEVFGIWDYVLIIKIPIYKTWLYPRILGIKGIKPGDIFEKIDCILNSS